MRPIRVFIPAAALFLGIQGGANATSVYFNDFESAIGPQVTLTSGSGVLGLDSVPSPGSKFLGLNDSLADGGLGDNEVTLNLSTLPAHTTMTVQFDAYSLRTMDGGFTCCGPDYFVVELGSFTRTTTLGGLTQAFPNFIETGGTPLDNAAYTGGTLLSLGVFHPFSFTIPHSDSSVVMSWSMSGLQGVFDEGWGLDNVRVEVVAIPEPPTYALLMAGLGLIGWFSRHRQ